MKKFHEFLKESELDDLRADLVGLGFTRWEVEISGEFVDDEWVINFTAEGKGDTKEEAAEFAISVILQMLYRDYQINPPDQKKDLYQNEYYAYILKNKEISDFQWYWYEEEYGVATDLVQKTLSNSLWTQNLYKGIMVERKLKVDVKEYEGMGKEGVVEYEIDRIFKGQ